MAGRYHHNPIPTRFLTPIDSFQIPAQRRYFKSPPAGRAGTTTYSCSVPSPTDCSKIPALILYIMIRKPIEGGSEKGGFATREKPKLEDRTWTAYYPASWRKGVLVIRICTVTEVSKGMPYLLEGAAQLRATVNSLRYNICVQPCIITETTTVDPCHRSSRPFILCLWFHCCNPWSMCNFKSFVKKSMAIVML